MKKVFVMMILILAVGMAFGQIITIHSATLSNNDGVSSYIPQGSTGKVEFTYSTEGITGTLSVIDFYLLTFKPGGDVHPLQPAISSFDSATGTNVTRSVTFVMPELTGESVSDTKMFVNFAIKKSSWPPTTSNSINSNEEFYIDPTLPVELSAFDAVATAEDFVNINWTVQSETNISGYFIIRGLENNIDSALMIPAFINATNSAQEHSYTFTDREVTTNNIYYYWLQSVEFSLETELFGPTMVKVGNPTGGETIPVAFGNQLIGNYPNPFNPSTSVSFSVANPGPVTINIFNIKGQLVKNLYNSNVSANMINQRIDVLWHGKDNNGKEVASGVYYTKMKSGNFVEFKKMLLMK